MSKLADPRLICKHCRTPKRDHADEILCLFEPSKFTALTCYFCDAELTDLTYFYPHKTPLFLSTFYKYPPCTLCHVTHNDKYRGDSIRDWGDWLAIPALEKGDVTAMAYALRLSALPPFVRSLDCWAMSVESVFVNYELSI